MINTSAKALALALVTGSLLLSNEGAMGSRAGIAAASPSPMTAAHVDLTILNTSVKCLSYLALGSTAHEGKYAAEVRAGVEQVVNLAGDDTLTKSAYSGFIAVFPMLFLSELLYDKKKLTDDALRKKVLQSLQKFINLVEAGQKLDIGMSHGTDGDGAWGYGINEINVKGLEGRRKAQAAACCLIGLLTARKAGANVTEERLKKAVEYLKRCVSRSGEVGYQGIGTDGKYAGYGRTAGWLYCATLLGYTETPEYRRALAWLDSKKPEKDFDAHGGIFAPWGYIWGGAFHVIRKDEKTKSFFTEQEDSFRAVRNEDGMWNGQAWKSKDGKLSLSAGHTGLAILGILLKDGRITVLNRGT